MLSREMELKIGLHAVKIVSRVTEIFLFDE